jgi:hypothetical protein
LQPGSQSAATPTCSTSTGAQDADKRFSQSEQYQSGSENNTQSTSEANLRSSKGHSRSTGTRLGSTHRGRLALAYPILLFLRHVFFQSVVWHHLVSEEERHTRRVRRVRLCAYSWSDVSWIYGNSENLNMFAVERRFARPQGSDVVVKTDMFESKTRMSSKTE